MSKRAHNNELPNYGYPIPSREDILAAMRTTAGPVKREHLAHQLGVALDELEGFDRRLGAMERDGQLLTNRKGQLMLATKLDFISGKVSGHRDGYGFLQRDDGQPDVFLGPKEMHKVLHGDRVLIKLTGTDYRGKPEGTIVEVIERRTDKLVGRFISERGVTIVVPEDQRIKHDILVPPGETSHAQHGQVVMVQIIEQPSRYSQPLGRVIEILGEVDDPGMEIEIAVRKFDVPHEFSDETLEQAAQLPEGVTQADLQGRIDLRDVPLVTIDGEDARDFDDAVYCEPIDLGTGKNAKPGWRLVVAIADVSHYVVDGEPLDNDAIERATSVYFPRKVIPMLPEKLSNGLCSLNPNVDRLCMVCDAVIAADGEKAGQVVAYQFYPAVMHSQARLTYTEVWAALSQPHGPVANKWANVLPHLSHLYELFQCLLKARHERGAVDFETVETQIVCNELGRIERIIPRHRNDAHRLIEECMLAANVCAADFMARSKHPGLYRIHEGPTPEKLSNLRNFLKTLNLTLEGGEDPQASDYAKLMMKVKERPDAQLTQNMVLRSMQQAIYSPDNVGHFGLAYPAYAHFTSPIRRYPDLLVHRCIKALLHGKRYRPQAPEGAAMRASDARELEHAIWETLGMQCSAYERRADEASRDVQAWLKCYYMKDRVGEVFSGTVSSVAPFGLFITLDELYVDGLVHITELGTEYFQFNEALHELRGERTGIRYRLTDRVQVQVSRVDIENRKIDFRLVQSPGYNAVMRTAKAQSPQELDYVTQRTKQRASRSPAPAKTTEQREGKQSSKTKRAHDRKRTTNAKVAKSTARQAAKKAGSRRR